MRLGEQCVRWFMEVDLFGIQFNQITVTVLLSVYICALLIEVFLYLNVSFTSVRICCVFLCFILHFFLPDVANKRVHLNCCPRR